MMTASIVLFGLGAILFVLAYAHLYDARAERQEAERMLRFANERLYEVDALMKKQADRFVRNMTTGVGKVLKFEPRHLKSVPAYDDDDTNGGGSAA